jgi:hypothetical protein
MRFVSILALLLSASVAAETPVSAKLVSDPFLESYQPEVSVSGNVIVGVMALSAASAILDNQIAVRSTAEAPGGEICLRVASRDGIYTSRNIYSLPKGVSGPVILPYQSTHRDVVKSYGDDEIALAATSGDCDSGSSDFFLLAAGDVVIYLNSFGATDVFYELDAEINPCEYITEGRRTTYDHICRLGAIDVGKSVPVTIIRERFGREQPSIDITIVGAAE